MRYIYQLNDARTIAAGNLNISGQPEFPVWNNGERLARATADTNTLAQLRMVSSGANRNITVSANTNSLFASFKYKYRSHTCQMSIFYSIMVKTKISYLPERRRPSHVDIIGT